MRRSWTRLVVVLVLVGVAACGGSGGESGAGSSTTVIDTSTTTAAALDGGLRLAEPPYVSLYDDPAVGWSDDWGPIDLDTIQVLLADDAPSGTIDHVVVALEGLVIGQSATIPLYEVLIGSTSLQGVADAIALAAAIPGVDSAFATQYGSVREPAVCGVTDSSVYQGRAAAAYDAIGLERAYELIRGSGVDLHPSHVGVVDAPLPVTDEIQGAGAVSVRAVESVNRLEMPQHHVVNQLIDGKLEPYKDYWSYPKPHLIPAASSAQIAGSHAVAVTNILAGQADNGGVNGVLGDMTEHVTLSHASAIGDAWTITAEEWARLGQPPEDFQETLFDDLYSGRFTPIRGIVMMEGLVRDGATVINLSAGPFSLSSDNSASAAAIRRYFERTLREHPNVTFVIAAGNSGQALDGTNDWFAGHPLDNVITVSATDPDGGRPTYANTATGQGEVSLVAVGELPLKVDPETGKTIIESGTSFAAPQVAGAATMLRALDPTLTAAELKHILSVSASATTNVGGVSVPVDPALGGKMLRVDHAVYRVLTERLGVTLSYDELIARGSLTFTASQTSPLTFEVTASLGSARPEGTQVFVQVDGAGTLGGISPQILQRPGQATWPFEFAEAEQQATLTASRLDSGACAHVAVASTELLAGTYLGSFPFAIPGVVGFSADVPFTALVGYDGTLEAHFEWSGLYDYGSGVMATMTLEGACTGSYDSQGIMDCTGAWWGRTEVAGMTVDNPGTFTTSGSIADDVLTATIEAVGTMSGGNFLVTAQRQG